MRVMIVDDEKLICEWLEFCISANPACTLVGVAHNGREGLELYCREKPELVLTDIKMPVMDGLELLHAIRQQSSGTKVVLLTAFADFEMARNALREGADEYLLKTEMNSEVLQEMLSRMMLSCCAGDAAERDSLTNTAQAHAIVGKILRQQEPLQDQDLQELRQCGLRWRDNGLFALAVWKQSLMNGGLHFPKDGPARHVAGFDYSERIYMVVGNLPRALSAVEKERQLALYARQVQTLNGCMVGSSSVTDEMSRIPAMARQAAFSLSRGFYEGRVCLYQPEEPLEVQDVRMRTWRAKISAIRVQLYQLTGAALQQLLEEVLQDTAKQQIGEVEAVTKFCTDCYDLLYAQATAMSLEAEKPEQLRRRLAASISMAETVQPVLELDFMEFAGKYEDYEREIEELTEAYRQADQEKLAELIADKTAAYIASKGDALGLDCTPQVETQPRAGVPHHSAVTLDIPEAAALAAWISEELAIDRAHQYWREADE